MKPKEPRISVRVDDALKERIEAVCNKTGLDEAQLVRNCIIALCDSVEKNGTITFPLEIKAGKDCGTDAGCAGHQAETNFILNDRPGKAALKPTRK